MAELSIRDFIWHNGGVEESCICTYEKLIFQSYTQNVTTHIIDVYNKDTCESTLIVIHPSIEYEDYRYRVDFEGEYENTFKRLATEFRLLPHYQPGYDDTESFFARNKKDIDAFFKKIFKKRNKGF